jgi:hypothetical protein
MTIQPDTMSDDEIDRAIERLERSRPDDFERDVTALKAERERRWRWREYPTELFGDEEYDT